MRYVDNTNTMSSNITVYPFTNKIGTTLTPHFPGAYIVRGAAGANGLIPIYTSMANFADNNMTELLNDRDAQVLVLPGFTLQLYSGGNYSDDAYVHTLGLIDNSGGTDLLSRTATTVASSCKLFFKSRIGFKELLLVADTFNPVSTINTGSLTISPSYNATSTATFSSTSYRLYEFKSTTINSTFSYTGSSAITMRFLLVGGGGGGAFSYVDEVQVAGGGGGGAGAFVYGTIVVSPGDTFTVQIGIGGAGIQDTTGIGSTSSITRIVGTSASLIAGGGGSGGGPGDASTLQGIYPSGIGGSSGGTYPGYGATQTARAVAANKYTLTGSGFTIDISFSNIGGTSPGNGAGSGGGGAGGVGGSPSGASINSGGVGGAGATWPVIGSSRIFAAGGGGNNHKATNGQGGTGGSSGIGGDGGSGSIGDPNTGSGGGARWNAPAGNGGSGICIIAVPI